MMAADLDALLREGGKGQVGLLQYSVYAARPEILFVFLAGEYRLAPTAAKALALYEQFCAAAAPARLDAAPALEPHDLRLPRGVAPLRPRPPAEGDPPPPTPPAPAHLFASLVGHLREAPEGAWRRAAASYDPALGPHENLPGGRMTAPQRHFVERVWRPRVQPALVAVGFWRAAALGG